jgi:uncharacterized protein YdeI (YjbR/CyaY-like superfamily)
MNSTNPKVDAFLIKTKQWQQVLPGLRSSILDCQLTEEMKWRFPCYTLQGRNIVIIQAFKEYCAVLFFKGALLKDAKGVLVRPGENTQAGRQMRFANARDVAELGSTLKAYVIEAIEVEKSGLKVPLKKAAEYALPDELKRRLDANAALKRAFHALTPGRQRMYVMYVSQAKQSATRESRIEKYIQHILSGKGMND